MKYIDADKLIAEIERRKANASAVSYIGQALLCEELLDFINSLPEDEPSEDLEKAAEEYAYINWESDDYHEGADKGLPFDAIGHTAKCFKAGAEWQKEQMMKEDEEEKHIMLSDLEYC